MAPLGGGSALLFRARTGSASSLKQLVASNAFELDARVLSRQASGCVPARVGETPYIGVDCELILSPPISGFSSTPSTPTEAAEVLRDLLRDAVDAAVGSARRIAVMAGGGLDSAALLALAHDWAQRRGGSVFAVALDFAARGDDRPHLRALEKHLGCDVVRIAPEDAAHRLRPVLSGVDAAPVCPPGAIAEIELLARARELGADRVLCGAGGDDLFDGDPRSLGALARRGHVLQAVRSAKRMRAFPRTPRSRLASWIVRPLLARYAPTPLRLALARRAAPHAPDWAGPVLHEMLRDQAARSVAALDAQLRTTDTGSLDPGVTADLSLAHRMYLAWWRHHEEVAAGIERRDPFLDPSVGRFIASIPAEWLLHGDIRRGLFRTAFRGLLPETLRIREDKAFIEPAFSAVVRKAGGFEILRPLAERSMLASMGIVDAVRFKVAFDQFLQHHDRMPWTIWYFLAVEAFLRSREGRAW